MDTNRKSKDILLVNIGIGKGWSIFRKKKLFIILENYCTNPDCLCRSVYLSCHELDKNCNTAIRGIQFAFSLNIDNWSAEMIDSPEEIKEQVNCIIDTMLKKLTHRLKKRFQDRYKTAKDINQQLESLNDEISIDDINSGLCVGYNDIYSDSFSFSAPFIHDYKGRTFYFYDRYCINPRCQCNEALLTAICENTDKLIKDEYFTARLQFSGKKSMILKNQNVYKARQG